MAARGRDEGVVVNAWAPLRASRATAMGPFIVEICQRFLCMMLA